MSVRDAIFSAMRSARPIERVGFSQQQSASATSLVIDTPVGVVDDDVLVAMMFTPGTTGSWTLPTGWIAAGRDTNNGLTLAYKTAASEGANHTFSFGGAATTLCGEIVAYRNAKFGWTKYTAGSNTAPAVRAGVDRTRLVALFTRNSASATFTTPTGMTFVDSNSDGTSPSWAVFDEVIQRGSSGTRTTSPSVGTTNVALMFTLYPSTDFSVVAPEYVGEAHTQNAATGATLTIDRPHGVMAGDLLVAFMSANGGSGTWTDAGWTEVADQAALPSLRVAWKVAGSLEPNVYTFTNSLSSQILAGCVVAYGNAAFDSISGIATGSSGASATTSSSAPTVDFCRAIGFVCNSLASKTLNRQANSDVRFQADTFTRYADSDATAPSQLVVDYGLWGADNLTISYTPSTATGTTAAVHLFLKPAPSYVEVDRPSFALNLFTEALGSLASFTRSGPVATRFNAFGVLETKAANEPRIDHDPSTLTSSTTSNSIGYGSKTFAVSYQYTVGDVVRASVDASNWLLGIVTASSPTSVTLDVSSVYSGSGTHTSWTLIRVLALLIEEQRTNLLLHSHDYTNAAWTKTATTVTPNASDGPRGAMTMTSLVDTNISTSIIAQNRTIVAGSTLCYWTTLKRGNHDWVRVRCDSGGNAFQVWVNVADGTLGTLQATGTAAAISASITNMGGGVYQIVIVGKVDPAATAAGAMTMSAVADLSTVRVLNGERYQDMSQLEVGATPSSYIPTTSAQVTRTADIATVEVGSWYNASEGALFVDATAPGNAQTSAFARLLQLDDGTTSNYLALQRNSGIGRLFGFVGGVQQAGLNLPAWANGARAKAAAAYTSTEVAGTVNGGAVSTGAWTSPAALFTTLKIGGQHFTGAGFFNGHIRELRYYPRRLTNAQLQALTV